jgi:hypothetical protein
MMMNNKSRKIVWAAGKGEGGGVQWGEEAGRGAGGDDAAEVGGGGEIDLPRKRPGTLFIDYQLYIRSILVCGTETEEKCKQRGDFPLTLFVN